MEASDRTTLRIVLVGTEYLKPISPWPVAPKEKIVPDGGKNAVASFARIVI